MRYWPWGSLQQMMPHRHDHLAHETNVLQEREVRGREAGQQPTCHFFNSFWLPALVSPQHDQYNYPKVSRWTSLKKLRRSAQTAECVLDLERLIVPVHLGMHWTTAVIDLEHREIRYYDSMAVSLQTLLSPALPIWKVMDASLFCLGSYHANMTMLGYVPLNTHGPVADALGISEHLHA